jgi:hypothetical protein
MSSVSDDDISASARRKALGFIGDLLLRRVAAGFLGPVGGLGGEGRFRRRGALVAQALLGAGLAGLGVIHPHRLRAERGQEGGARGELDVKPPRPGDAA